MLTFKQLEALYWIVQLGSFEAAAAKLNAGQSAISKRIQELESTFDIELFDRTRRSAKLTERGEELFYHAKDLLDRRDAAIERVSTKDLLVRKLSIGVTELTALTWLPQLVEAIRRAYPRVTVEAEVDLGSPLRDRLAAGTIDLIVVPDAPISDRFVSIPLAAVENAWMCVPTLVPESRVVPLAEISQFPLLTQGMSSGTGATYTRFLQDNGVRVTKALSSNNLVAQIGLTLSGLGVSYLPKECLSYLIENGLLGTIETEPPLPPVRYVAMYRSDHPNSLNHEVAQLASECCDFGRILLKA
ncbi:LysR family transcriptional regulator [Paraburkholderia sp. BL18I3N2]|uniref:LysR family transcriptional regulator n=1 Tax=Paraburkholderia sp. BL18I3N2 TaxID=1938799 RepID=UPI000D053102|nr:LysR family transcriptional regulator [Paraburkholderia sp. BL18I3N2]PRX21648.1 LysR family transcriptional regulator [Paraburkholderia sp. BL18I3N2]